MTIGPEKRFVKRLAFLALLPCVVVLGCSQTDRQGPLGSTEAGSPAKPEGPAVAPTEADVERSVAIYASVIRRLVTKDHTFGDGDPGFEVVYVLDGVVRGAGDPMKSTSDRPKKALAEEVKVGLRATLADLPPVSFVRRRSSVIEGDEPGSSPGRVRDGVLVTLGPIVGGERTVEVPANLWIDGKAALWLTYVVRKRGTDWKLTGTTGPMAIS